MTTPPARSVFCIRHVTEAYPEIGSYIICLYPARPCNLKNCFCPRTEAGPPVRGSPCHTAWPKLGSTRSRFVFDFVFAGSPELFSGRAMFVGYICNWVHHWLQVFKPPSPTFQDNSKSEKLRKLDISSTKLQENVARGETMHYRSAVRKS